MTRESKIIDVTWSTKGAADSGGGTLIGYASTFGNTDRGGDVVAPGAFTKSIAGLRARGGIPLLADHSASTGSVLGTIVDASEDSQGLRIEAVFSSAASAQEVRTKLREGHLSKLSIGYEVVDETYETRGQQQVRVLREVKLWEASVVVFPMNAAATVTGVKGDAADLAAIDERLEVEAALVDLARESTNGDHTLAPSNSLRPYYWEAKAAEHDRRAENANDLAQGNLHRKAAREYRIRASRERLLLDS